jgi:1-acyl-sn-glycerol-3-phosphate acyltransferase
MTVFRSILFNVFLFGSLTIFLFGAVLLLPLPERVMERAVTGWTYVARWGLKLIVGLDHEVRGQDNLPDGPAILASKHQSAWDTMAFLWLFPRPVYVVKKELLSIPLWGWCAARCGHIPVDRAGGAGTLKQMVRSSRAALEKGRHVVIFPEGTRVAPGEKRPFHPGIAALYAQAAVPVVPVALNSGIFWGRRSFHKRSGRIVLEFLPAIPPGLDRKAFLRELENRLETAGERLLVEARQTT